MSHMQINFSLANDCPRQSEFRNYNDTLYEEEVNVTLFTKGLQSNQQGQLLGDTIECAFLDAAEKWLHCYIESLEGAKKEQVTYQDS